MDDNSLLRAIATGDDLALRQLFEGHAPWLAARLRRSMRPDAVEDVLQETFIAVWKSARSFKGEGEVGAWLWGIARRQAAMWHRKHGRTEAETELSLDMPGTEDVAITASSRTDLERALTVLGPEGNEHREMVRLLWQEGHSVAEVALRLGIPEGTVKSRAYRARHLLRAALEEAGPR
jgi:RNA polymerase sigma-70 factor (ECF subfamily)